MKTTRIIMFICLIVIGRFLIGVSFPEEKEQPKPDYKQLYYEADYNLKEVRDSIFKAQIKACFDNRIVEKKRECNMNTREVYK